MSSKAFNRSAINEYFRNKSVLITGFTGLVGKVLAFKILLSIETIKTVYVLIREKNEKNSEQRFREIVGKSRDLFSYLDKSLLEKLVPISGDVSLIGLGLSECQSQQVINNVSIVFHSAADITFETNLKHQILTNVGGTKEVIDLCTKLKEFEALVYVSTAYSNPSQFVIEEKVYKNHQNPYELLEIARNSNEDLVASEYLGDFPNTYTFTKNLAETLIDDEFHINKLFATIVRPGVVAPSYREPISGWIDSLNGITGAILMGAVGLARCGRGDLEARIDPIPVDIVANTCIIAAWTTAVKYNDKLKVYNCNSSCNGAPRFDFYLCEMQKHVLKYPLLKTIRPIGKPTNKFYMLPGVYHFIRFFSETCFAAICDFGLLCIGEQRFVLKLMNRLHRVHDAMQCFIARKWYFTNNNFNQLNDELIGIDKTVFDCDVRQIDWMQFFKSSYFTWRKVFLKEKISDVERAQFRIKFLNLGYSITNHLLLSIAWYFLLSIIAVDSLFEVHVSDYNLTVGSIGYQVLLLSASYNAIASIFL